MCKIVHIITLLLLLAAGASRAQAQTVVIANKSVQEQSVDAAAMRNFFTLGKTQWSNGARVTVVELKPDGVSKEAFYGFIGMRPADVRKQWMRVQLSGEGQPPAMLDSEEAVVKLVAATPGAIGYVSAAAATGEVKKLAAF